MKTTHNLNAYIGYIRCENSILAAELAAAQEACQIMAEEERVLITKITALEDKIKELRKPPAAKAKPAQAQKRPYTRRAPLKTKPKIVPEPTKAAEARRNARVAGVNPNTVYVDVEKRPVYDEEYLG